MLHTLQHYTFWKKEVPIEEEELKKFQLTLVNLDVPIRLYKEAYEKHDVTGYENNKNLKIVILSGKTSLIAAKYTHAFYATLHLFCRSYSNSVSYIDFLRILCPSEEGCVKIVCSGKELFSFENLRLTQTLPSNKTGFARPGHI